MSIVNFTNIKISGMAATVPSHCIDNMEYASVLGTEMAEKIIKNIGVRQHYKSERRQTAGDLAYCACKNLLEKKDVAPSEIGAVIYLTTSPDYMIPATAFVLHKRLGLENDCIAFDVNLSCAAFVYGLQIAGSMLQGMSKKYILLVNGHAPKHLDVQDRKDPDHSSLMMFGDAATATIVERTDENSTISTALYADGSDFKMLCTLGGCRCVDASREVSVWSDGKEHSLFDAGMDGVGVFFFATTKAPEAIKQFLADKQESIDDYNYIFLHQANKKILQQITKKIGVTSDKVPITIDKYGNTSGCSIPLGVVDFFGKDTTSGRKKLILCGYGSGMSWGVASVEIDPEDVFEVTMSDEIYEEGELHPF